MGGGGSPSAGDSPGSRENLAAQGFTLRQQVCKAGNRGFRLGALIGQSFPRLGKVDASVLERKIRHLRSRSPLVQVRKLHSVSSSLFMEA